MSFGFRRCPWVGLSQGRLQIQGPHPPWAAEPTLNPPRPSTAADWCATQHNTGGACGGAEHPGFRDPCPELARTLVHGSQAARPGADSDRAGRPCRVQRFLPGTEGQQPLQGAAKQPDWWADNIGREVEHSAQPARAAQPQPGSRQEFEQNLGQQVTPLLPTAFSRLQGPDSGARSHGKPASLGRPTWPSRCERQRQAGGWMPEARLAFLEARRWTEAGDSKVSALGAWHLRR